ncbi:Crp/Fnr family transcriptional regulator [soil metagenome]
MADTPDRCLDCLVREAGLCSTIDENVLSALSAIGRRRVLGGGQVLTWAGDANLLCANVVSGILKITASTMNGREQIVGLLFAGDFVGQPFMEESTLTATALVETELCLFPRERFERVLGEHQGLEHALLRRTMTSLNDARERMLTLGQRGAQERVAGFLLDLVDRAGSGRVAEATSFEIPISRGDMADFLGLTIETVSRQLTKLKGLGAISLTRGGRSVDVTARGLLEAVANPD